MAFLRRNEGNNMSHNVTALTDYSVNETSDSKKILELMEYGFTSSQIKLLLPFWDKISTLKTDGIALLKEKMELGGFCEASPLCDNEDEADAKNDSLDASDKGQLPAANSFVQIIDTSISESFNEMSRHVAQNVALAVSKEVNMHILSIKEEQDMRITNLEKSIEECRLFIQNTYNKPVFQRRSKKNRSVSNYIGLFSERDLQNG